MCDGSHLDEELLVAGPPPPSRLASPGPARAPRPAETKTRDQKPHLEKLRGSTATPEVSLFLASILNLIFEAFPAFKVMF